MVISNIMRITVISREGFNMEKLEETELSIFQYIYRDFASPYFYYSKIQ